MQSGKRKLPAEEEEAGEHRTTNVRHDAASSSSSSSLVSPPPAISEEEAALYDRQIRLWGAQAQQRMRASRVLLCNLRGLLVEVAKNIVLAGVGSVTLLDAATVSEADLSAQFFLGEADIGKNRGEACLEKIKALNPKVEVRCEAVDLDSKTEEELCSYNVICLSNCSLSSMLRVDKICRKHKIPLFITDSFGYQAFIFSDLDRYVYIEEETDEEKKYRKKQNKNNNNNTEPKKQRAMHTKEISSPSLEDVFSTKVNWADSTLQRTPKLFFTLPILSQWSEENGGRYPTSKEEEESLLKFAHEMLSARNVPSSFLSDEFIRTTAKTAMAELSPVCAIVGGILGQQVINVLSGKDEPLHNFFFYDVQRGVGLVEKIGPTSSSSSSSSPNNEQQSLVIEL
ncbi:E1 ubiquitin-activating protein aos1 [Balamuthia mandrillaris]